MRSDRLALILFFASSVTLAQPAFQYRLEIEAPEEMAEAHGNPR